MLKMLQYIVICFRTNWCNYHRLWWWSTVRWFPGQLLWKSWQKSR